MAWKVRDPLYRGDGTDGVTPPDPTASTTLVEHVLYFGGRGRRTPYLSLTEALPTAIHFAGDGGAVWETAVPRLAKAGVAHRSRKELLGLLKPPGKGPAGPHTTYELMRARVLVEQWGEHLADFGQLSPEDVPRCVSAGFSRRPRR